MTESIDEPFSLLKRSLINDSSNSEMRKRGWKPVYSASATSRIAVIGQAPGHKAQASGVPWDDASGKKLMEWLGVSEEEFRDPAVFALLPMDFYYPGAGRSGDLPPRKGFAARWHPPLFALMPQIRLTLLIGRYAQAFYLPSTPDNPRPKTLTETVANYERYLPDQFPIVHPSPLNFRWQTRNPWFVSEVLPVLRERVHAAIKVS